MSKKKSYCPYDDPDCFNCPFDDCKASLVDLNRQQAVQKKKELAERNRIIVDSFKKGASVKGLADRYGITEHAIIVVLHKAGLSAVRRKNYENASC